MNDRPIENTLAALRQVVEAMEQGKVKFLLDLSPTEEYAYNDLFYVCKSFMDLSVELGDRNEFVQEDEEE